MKRIDSSSSFSIPNLNVRLTLMCVVLMTFSITALGQKDVCNDRIVHNCDLRTMNSTCTKNGQVLPCKTTPTPENDCGGSGLLIIKLNKATNYYERSGTYTAMNDQVKCRHLNVGFFGAASEVTRAFYVDTTYWTYTGSYTEITRTFFGQVSAKLVQQNNAAFKELTETGKLLGIEGKYVTSPEEIDRQLVAGEQLIVEKALDEMGNSPQRDRLGH